MVATQRGMNGWTRMQFSSPPEISWVASDIEGRYEVTRIIVNWSLEVNGAMYTDNHNKRLESISLHKAWTSKLAVELPKCSGVTAGRVPTVCGGRSHSLEMAKSFSDMQEGFSLRGLPAGRWIDVGCQVFIRGFLRSNGGLTRGSSLVSSTEVGNTAGVRAMTLPLGKVCWTAFGRSSLVERF